MSGSYAVAIAGAGLLVAGCGSRQAPTQEATAASTSPGPASSSNVRPPAICAAERNSLPSLAAVAALGKPTEEARFTLAQPLTEFRVKLLNHFVLPRDAATAIWERSWAEGDCRLTVWSVERAGGWVSVEQLAWSKGDSF